MLVAASAKSTPCFLMFAAAFRFPLLRHPPYINYMHMCAYRQSDSNAVPILCQIPVNPVPRLPADSRPHGPA